MKEKKAAAVKGSASQILVKYRKNISLDEHLKTAKLGEEFKFIPGYYRILSNQEDPSFAGADYLNVEPGKPMEGTVVHRKEVKEFVKKPEINKNGKPVLKVRNPKGEIVKVA